MKTVIEMAREAGWTGPEDNLAYVAMLERFAELVRADERARMAEQQTDWEAVAADQAMTIALLRAEQPSQHQEPVGTVQCINGVTIGYLDVMQPVGTKLYTSSQPAQPSKPLPFNKEDMEGLDINQRLGFKLGWKSAEAAHNIKENT